MFLFKGMILVHMSLFYLNTLDLNTSTFLYLLNLDYKIYFVHYMAFVFTTF